MRAEPPSTWWSLRPLHRPDIPRLHDDDGWAKTPIDAFILAKLYEKGLSPSPQADRRTLIRRLYFDLIGLPPAPEEIEAFLADKDPLAYEKLVDRLLASPRYGERWARHWLDVVHFGETHGYDKDKPREHAWPYRDYVIRAFNEDKPYARFVQEQIAGDVLFPFTRDGIEALGFISAGPWDFIGHVELPETKIDGRIARHLDRDDMVTNTIQTFISLTIQCAQCHDHKFDPITQEDYYSLQAVFAAVDRTDRKYDLDPVVAKKRQELIARFAGLLARALLPMNGENQQALGQELASSQRELGALPAQSIAFIGAVHSGTGSFRGTGPDGGKPRPIFVLLRGNVQKPGEPVGPGALHALTALPCRFDLPLNHSEGDRRAALACWLTDPRNPHTWRSIVNRVWQYHFGRGIVDTPNDFGKNGGLPSHPELLDWLAADFRDHGQSLKRLHRMIACSATYQQISDFGFRISDSHSTNPKSKIQNPKLEDADNRYLSHMNRRRLEAEAIRDSVLAVAGKLNSRMCGPSFRDFVIDKPEHSPHYEYLLHNPDDPNSHRRSIYRFAVRSQPQPFMTALDCADPSMQVARRNESLSALQALTLLNNDLMVVMARHYAGRLEKQDGDLAAKVERAFYECLGRPPSAAERDALTKYAAQHGLANLCRLLYNLNEFVFVD
ncbi:MAG TPA: DUF1549 and DUF1553 domain-containing protein [Gemmataceae bacterium]|nr:DUF1549 and DUF1553 domain-containing protein [Gemmataceae bacterium]